MSSTSISTGSPVDIDLNYVGALDLAAMERERPEVDAAIDRLFASQGYGVRRRPTGHAGGKWLARYASALGGNASLELDLNYMARQPLFGAVRMESCILGRVGTGARSRSLSPRDRGRKDRGAVRPGCRARPVRCTAHPRDREARSGLDQGVTQDSGNGEDSRPAPVTPVRAPGPEQGGC